MASRQRSGSPTYTETHVLSNLRSDLSDLKRDFAGLQSSDHEAASSSPLHRSSQSAPRPSSSRAPLSPPKDYRDTYRFGGVGASAAAAVPSSRNGAGYVKVLAIEDGDDGGLDVEEGEEEEDSGDDDDGMATGKSRASVGGGRRQKKAETSSRLQESSNVLLLYRLQSLRLKSFANFLLAVFALLFGGLNLVMIVLNSMNHNDQDCDDPRSRKYQPPSEHSVFEARCGSPVSVYTFHLVEFTATFVFSLVQAFALLCSPTPPLSRKARREAGAASVADNPFALKVVLVMAVVVNAVPTLLIWFNINAFEVPAHEIEYANEVTMSFIDLAFFTAILRARAAAQDASDSSSEVAAAAAGSSMVPRSATTGMVMAIFAATIALFQLYIYNGMGTSDDGERLGEKPAHYCEFAFEIISAVVTFLFCIDSKFVIDHEIDSILFTDNNDDGDSAALLSAAEAGSGKGGGVNQKRVRESRSRRRTASVEKPKAKGAGFAAYEGKKGTKARGPK